MDVVSTLSIVGTTLDAVEVPRGLVVIRGNSIPVGISNASKLVLDFELNDYGLWTL